MDPLHPPEQVALVAETVNVRTGGAVIVADVVAVHPFPSVAVNVYPPAHNPVMEAVVLAFVHKYENVGVPPLRFARIVALQSPLQFSGFGDAEAIEAVNTAGCPTLTVPVAVHPPASVIVTE